MPDSKATTGKRATKPAAETESSGQSLKASITFFPADNERITAISMALAKHGQRISASHAIRLALRAVEIDEKKFLRLLDEMKAEDGRSLRFAKKT
jgi:predicted DCC family thiol-disulfide oxidoreductase YuxK